jgi:hypothetical protein
VAALNARPPIRARTTASFVIIFVKLVMSFSFATEFKATLAFAGFAEVFHLHREFRLRRTKVRSITRVSE